MVDEVTGVQMMMRRIDRTPNAVYREYSSASVCVGVVGRLGGAA